tara:strand:- start:919 stop:1455 length:537 start_codon:yes stop_codon:yes gene_type:complete
MIIHKITYAGDTPLFSDFIVTQTGPMQLTISGGIFQITGQARILDKKKIPPAFFQDGRAELMPDGKRARVWLQNKITKQIKDKSKRRTIVGNTVVNIVAHSTKDKYYQIDLRSPSDTVMLVDVNSWFSNVRKNITPDLTHTLVFPFLVPVGTTDLSGIDIKCFKVLPGFPPEQPEWEV